MFLCSFFIQALWLVCEGVERDIGEMDFFCNDGGILYDYFHLGSNKRVFKGGRGPAFEPEKP